MAAAPPSTPASLGAGKQRTSPTLDAIAPLELVVTLAPEQIHAIAERAASLMADRAEPSPWFDTIAAARHLCCSPGRIHDLTQLGKLRPRRDGRRLLFRREDLDAYLESAG